MSTLKFATKYPSFSTLRKTRYRSMDELALAMFHLLSGSGIKKGYWRRHLAGLESGKTYPHPLAVGALAHLLDASAKEISCYFEHIILKEEGMPAVYDQGVLLLPRILLGETPDEANPTKNIVYLGFLIEGQYFNNRESESGSFDETLKKMIDEYIERHPKPQPKYV